MKNDLEQSGPIRIARTKRDRIVKLIIGHLVKAAPGERRTAQMLNAIMKSKLAIYGIRTTRLRVSRPVDEVYQQLKVELGPRLLAHYIKRVEKYMVLGAPALPRND